MMMKRGIKLLSTMAVVFGLQSALALEVYVNARAKTGGDGSVSRPFRTPQEARDAVRKVRADGGLGRYERVDVVFAPGDYCLDRTLWLDRRDGGTHADAPVVWRAEQPGTARFVGGVRVPTSSFVPVTDEQVRIRLPEGARDRIVVADVSALFPDAIPPMAEHFGGRPSGPLLYVNHRHLPIARWPNAGFVSFSQAIDHGSVLKKSPLDGSQTVWSPGAFVFSNERARRWHFDEGVWLAGYWTHDWSFHSVRAASYGAENGTNDVVRLACGVPYGVMNTTWGRKDRRFYVFNLLDELDAPGEWYLDRKNKLLYLYPPTGKVKGDDDVFLALLDGKMVQAQDGGLAHFRLQDLSFEYALGDGLGLKGDDLQILRCRIGCVGQCGVSIWGGGNLVSECEVSRCGTTGVNFGGGDRRRLVRAESTVEKCDIHDFGVYQRTYAPGIAMNGCGCTIRANLIHEAPHAACLYGGNEHLIEYNNVYRVLQETGDAGAYYTGRDWTSQGNVLRYNFTHELGREGADASTMGFYFDDCDCGDEVYGNIFWKVARGIMIGGGRDHPVRNNVFADCEIGMSIDARGVTWPNWNVPGGSWHLEGKALQIGYTNEIWATRYPRLAGIMDDSPRDPLYNPVEHNVFYDCRRHLVAMDGNSMSNALKRSSFVGNLVLNSCGTNGVRHAVPDVRVAKGFTVLNGSKDRPETFGFFNPRKGDFRLRPDARILRVMNGFRTIPTDRIPATK